jgi:hypothetical protein
MRMRSQERSLDLSLSPALSAASHLSPDSLPAPRLQRSCESLHVSTAIDSEDVQGRRFAVTPRAEQRLAAV